ncbi:AI-2E family transporter, partial [Streptomyces sp. Lzd4kr]|nr:AI-2E family transporter [Streptomyces sp. Lzd4kr]
MSRVPGWLGRVGAGLTEMSERLDERRAAVERESAQPEPVGRTAVATEPPPIVDPPPVDHVPRPPDH